ncbi:DNA mismatch repair protein MutS [Nordella sp. HKS 07]|uniref:Smr/MutS family protein n=1 Tax=Nordella sp. HKS 07 TaxID=2712222 RepID=UPI0013E1BBB2|nr:Smr/MutS family protein [Nordella sp. HKS 07]QIG48214.1 DNA mismatch repair protein MutS [Nordella sp. HKS 07]
MIRKLPPDYALWEDVARTVKPLHKAKKKPPAKADIPALGVKAKATPAEPQKAIARPPVSRHEPPPITGLDRRQERRMTRGQVEIEARIDLHGTGIERSHDRLLHFLIDSRARGLRLVLVITGKGASPFARHTLHGSDHYHAPERQGRLRRLAPEWFHETRFREHIAGFQPAHPRHGGGGAFYVKLRKKERSGR